MKKFNSIIERFNFKKIVSVYIILAVITGLASLGILANVYKDKLIFAYDFNKVSEEIEKGKFGVDSVKDELTSLAEKSADIADILILDRDNKVLFTAKKSEFGNAEFTLEEQKNERDIYLTYIQNPNISFRLMSNDDIMLSTIFHDGDREIEHHHKDKNFFRNNLYSKKIYLLSYITDRNTEDKIYFISNVHPVARGEFYIDVIGTVAAVFMALYWILLPLWVYQNARKAGTDAVLWGFVTLVTNLAGLFIYLIYKQSNKICYKCNSIQSRSNIYCKTCGTKIASTCESCKKIINDGDNFCNNCGSKTATL
jgi:hypothetical protein